MKRIALYGTDEAAELAYLTLKEAGLEPVAVFGATAGGQFLGFKVRALADLVADECDAVVVATFDRPEARVAELAGVGVAPDRILTLRRIERGRGDGASA